ncbi:MAG: hypothetical protein HQL69_09895 [Magnetococcales bacterium]|nr:hypothetical protein [Magnetococcales bacterium]
MANFMASAGFLLFLVLSLYGWGSIVLRHIMPNNSFGWAYQATFGMAFWIFLGGVLNFLSFATLPVLWSIMLAGILLSASNLKRNYTKFIKTSLVSYTGAGQLVKKLNSHPNWLGFGLLYLCIFLLIIFYIYSLMPTKVFTPSDDFWTYLARPLQMLGSGSLESNSPFSMLPIDSLGGQAFMQAFFLLYLDYEYINGLDVILCFFLSVFMVLEMAKKIGASFEFQLLAVTILIVWHPIISNTSTVYSATLFILAAVYSLMVWYENDNLKISIAKKIQSHIPFAFFISATITLKTTMALYVVVFFFFDFLVGLLLSKKLKPFIATYVTTGFVIIFITSPWLMVFHKKILAVLQSMVGSSYDSAVAVNDISFLNSLPIDNIQLYWGGKLYWYAIFFFLMISIAFTAIYIIIKKRDLPEHSLINVPIISLSFSIILYYFLTATVLPWGFAINHSVRYITPVLLSAMPLSAILLYSINNNVVDSKNNSAVFSYSLIKTTFIPLTKILLIVIVGAYSPLFVDRIQKLQEDRTMLSYMSKNARKSSIPKIVSMSSLDHKDEIKKIQSLVPEGEKILVWISTPFQIDFYRNKIEFVSSLDNSWNRTLGEDLKIFLQRLKQRGINYIFWQYEGFSMRGRQAYLNLSKNKLQRARYEGEYGLYFWDTLQLLQNSGEVLYVNDESKYALYKIKY